MQASSIIADPRTLPPGWTAHFDHQRNMWYYINLNTMPPQVSLVHPDDQSHGSQAPPVLRPRRDTAPSGPISHIQHHDTGRTAGTSNSTPYAAAIEAHNAKKPTFAQQLYASSLPVSLPTPPNSDDEGNRGSYGFSSFDVPWRTPSPQEDPSMMTSTLSTQTSYSTPPLSPMPIPSLSFSASSNSTSTSASSPPPFSSTLPEWNPPRVPPAPSRRPRGARSPSFPRAMVPTFALPPVEEGVADSHRDGDSLRVPVPNSPPPQLNHRTQGADGLRSDSLSLPSVSPAPPAPPASLPPMNYIPPPHQVRTRHNRAATFPNIATVNPMSTYSQSSTQISKPKETPTYTLVARSPEAPLSSTITTPAFQKFNNIPSVSTTLVQPIPTRPVLPGLIIPNSTGTGLPMGAGMVYNNSTLPNMNLPPTQFSIPANVNNDQHRIMAQGGVPNLHQDQALNIPNANTHGNHEVLKQVGIAVGKSAGKSALRLGTKVLLGSMGVPTNLFSSDDDGGDMISAGLTNMVASAATAGATAAFKASLNPPTASTHAAAPPPSSNLTPDYAAILAQMQAMQAMQPTAQQIMPQQTGLNPSGIQMANLMAQMQMMQLQQQQFRPPTQIPLGHMTAQNTGQSHLSSQQQRPQWQQSLVNNMVGGATHALVSGAMSNFDFPGTMDSDNAATSFTDFASFDAST